MTLTQTLQFMEWLTEQPEAQEAAAALTEENFSHWLKNNQHRLLKAFKAQA